MQVNVYLFQIWRPERPLVTSMLTDVYTTGNWQRVSFVGRLLDPTATDTTILLRTPTVGMTVEINGFMYSTGPNLYEAFDGATNGGTWAGTAYASVSTKTISPV